ncbi:hypothetical protein [Reinekea marinisedimentorum]|uniref:Flagellar hook-length control protein FliK n=1 Tax=Reinekea marinisedimentorum TaxID=230495 RepID=A0A4R3I8S9_9GAMM|nr:hypothetical protein [Reinekea marinisedimentorum]TCS41416.1 hypothetical protein BCF53_106147 [Reinekea marinisedimentorum]
MVGDGIRLPNDSTVASTGVHRGTGLPEAPARHESAAKPFLTTPLLTVVLETKAIMEGAKGGLYEVLLQNDPKSAPPITVQSANYVKPGTSMLLELNEQQIYRPVNKLTGEQFAKLAAIELDFWRAHILPKADSQQTNTLPKTSALAQLAETYPSLKPLVQWLNQRPTELTGSTLQRWVQEFTPLSTQKSWPALVPTAAKKTALAPSTAASGQAQAGTAASAIGNTPAAAVSVPLTNTHNAGTTATTPNQQPTAPAQVAHTSLNAPTTEPARQERAVPLEVTLSQWISKIDQLIKASPQELQQLLKQTAVQALVKEADLPGPAAKAATSPADDAQLLNLRNWLESSQARIQNLAVQTATQHFAAADQPAVHQMQLPLIWLGLTSWADIEWWQEKPKSDKDEKAKKEKQPRHWRMKIYLTMAPLSQVCADIDYSDDHTALTFWSEDTATLAHMNTLLNHLHQWTAGLGERTLQTKHGMPKRVNEDNQTDRDNHLVDIRT